MADGREDLGRLERRWSVPHGVMTHSDHGGLYRCREYLGFTRERGVVQNMSGRDSCYDNIVIESHFSKLQEHMKRLGRT